MNKNYNHNPETTDDVATESTNDSAEDTNNRRLIIMLAMGPALVFLLLIGGIVWAIVNGTGGEDERTSVQIFKEGDSGISVDDNASDFVIRYKAEGVEESFSVNKSAKDASTLAGHLLSLAKTGNNSSEYSPFYNVSGGSSNSFRRIIDITLDVSGSVISLANKDSAYYEKVRNKIKNILVQENLRPSDRVRLRFLGANSQSDAVYVIDFTGPQFIYNIEYQYTFDRSIITLKSYNFEKPVAQDSQVNATASSMAELFNLISAKHKQVLQSGSSPRTFLIPHLNKIINDNDVYTENKFGSIIYVVFTDGEFNLKPSVANRVGVSYCSSTNYKVCHSRLIDLLNSQSLLLGDSTSDSSKRLAVNPSDDEVFVVGLNREAGPIYSKSLENLFSNIFQPISTIKFLD